MRQEEQSPHFDSVESPAELPQPSDVPTDVLVGIEGTKSLRRVKVYEMQGKAWCDRGTGFCQGLVKEHEAVFHVSSEDSSDILLESTIIKDDLYQIQQNTLIVWQEPNGLDIALSFQEQEGCLEIWNFLRHVQKLLCGQEWTGPEVAHMIPPPPASNAEYLSDDEIDSAGFAPVYLPEPSLAGLEEVEELVHLAMASVARRESLTKFILEESYVSKLVATLEIAEDVESTVDLHRLCNIVKALILLNDAAIFESILKDDVFLGVAGILEYDPDFPRHKAEHRKYLGDHSKFKEVVEVKDPLIKLKIHQTFRLQYLKDVVLARILDDPTFSILNSLIFFNQVDIIQHFQHNDEFLVALFELFSGPIGIAKAEKKADAVLLIQQFTNIAKSLQAPARASFYNTFIEHGLFEVLVYSLGADAPANLRLAGAEIIMAVIDHDPKLIRGFIIERSVKDHLTLCSTLIDLLIREKNLGVKAQMTEAVRLLVDPSAGPPSEGPLTQRPGETISRQKKDDPEAEQFLELFYSRDFSTLVKPLTEAVFTKFTPLNLEQTALFTHLCDLLCFFIRAHTFRSKFSILNNNISLSVSRLFASHDRHLQLAALRYFRFCIGINDEFYVRNLIKNNLFAPIVDLLQSCSKKDNLLNSAVLEFFETIRNQNMKVVIYNLVENFRDKLEALDIETIRELLLRYEQYENPVPADETQLSEENRSPHSNNPSISRKMDSKQQEHFERDDPEPVKQASVIPAKRPLIDTDYDSDGEDLNEASETNKGDTATPAPDHSPPARKVASNSVPSESELENIASAIDDKVGEKRRRFQEDDDSSEFLRSRKANAVESKRSSGSNHGGLAGAVKRGMMFTFGKKEKDKG